MKLQKGITGFWEYSEGLKAPSIDTRHLYTITDKLKQGKKFNLIDIQEPSVSTNYYRIQLKDRLKGITLDILLNAHYPYYCGITSESSWMNLHFIEVPRELGFFFDRHFEYVAPAELNAQLDESVLSQLSNVERKQITYWNSQSVGEVMFNGYD